MANRSIGRAAMPRVRSQPKGKKGKPGLLRSADFCRPAIFTGILSFSIKGHMKCCDTIKKRPLPRGKGGYGDKLDHPGPWQPYPSPPSP